MYITLSVKNVVLEQNGLYADYSQFADCNACYAILHMIFSSTQIPGSSAYTQHWVLYPWDELIISISQVHEVGKPLH